MKIGVIAVVVVVSAIFALRQGLDYGTVNHVHYLLPGFDIAQPGHYERDWLVNQTTHYHQAWTYLSALLFMIGGGSPWPFVVVQVLTVTAMGVAIYAIVSAIVDKGHALAVFLLVMTILAITRTNSVGSSYLTHGYIQPSTFGALGLLAAGAYFLRGRYMYSGIALAAGGLLHINYLVLGGPIFFIAQLLSREDKLFKRLVQQLAVPTMALLLVSPTLLAAVGSPAHEQARDIMFNIRSPHHYAPKSYERGFLAFAGWQMLGAGVGLHWLLDEAGKARRLGALVAAFVAFLWLCVLLSTAYYVAPVAQLFAPRIAPISDLFAQILLAAAAVRFIRRPSSLKEMTSPAVMLALAGGGAFIMYSANHRQSNLAITVAALLFGPAIFAGLSLAVDALLKRFGGSSSAVAALKRQLPALSAALVLAIGVGAYAKMTYGPVSELKKHSDVFRGLNRNNQALFDWVKKNTPKDALFLTPPSLQTFRLHAQRAIVVDWKSVPHVPEEVLQWRQRLADVAGLKKFRNRRQVSGGYGKMTLKRLEQLQSKYDIDYMLMRRCGTSFTQKYRAVYRKRAYCLLELKPKR